MAPSKKNRFDADTTRLAEFARALAHPARIEILQMLAGQKTCICGDIVEVLPLAQSTVSQHLKELKELGIIKGEIDGPRSCYCINPEKLATMIGMMQDFLDELKNADLTTIRC